MLVDQIVPVENRKIQKLSRHFHANRVQSDILRSGSTITVAIKSGDRIATTAFQLRSENVRRHVSVGGWFFGRNGRFAFA